MKAIHNRAAARNQEAQAVNYTQRYKKWKQFTTPSIPLTAILMLWTIHKDTKNESNSQRHSFSGCRVSRCELYTKIQKMKAIHNAMGKIVKLWFAVNYTQRYKKWKQFTTAFLATFLAFLLWTIHKDTKNESNSQRGTHYRSIRRSCELYTKIQKMKAIHN